MAAGRRLYAALDLLDRQLVDRNGKPCGKVDDIELQRDPETGRILVSAILAGPGVLATRLGRKGFGSWMERMVAQVAPSHEPSPVRIPFGRVSDLGNRVTLAVEREDMATFATERWARDHVLRHLPGDEHRAPQ
jgi:sporulation protein YlmC with PRC-barrel domain